MRARASIFVASLLLFAIPAAFAQISGIVREDTAASLPIAGVKIRIQALDGSPEVITAANGTFTLPFTPTTGVGVAAAKPYDHAAGATNYLTEVIDVGAGPQTGVEFFLPVVPPRAATYTASSASSCASCHTENGNEWTTSRHANAARNTWVLDLFSGTGTPGGGAGYVFKNTHNVGDSGFCATCHAPLADIQAPGTVLLDAVTNTVHREGVNCVACHSIAKVDATNINGLHTAGGTIGKTDFFFPSGPNSAFQVFGNLPDVSTGFMRNIFNPLFGEALLCASCHQYKNPTTNAPGQSTFEEWAASSYATPGPGYKTCQTCHMPTKTPGLISQVGGIQRPASQRHRHDFVGITPSNLSDAIKLSTSVTQVGAELDVAVNIQNQGAGHNFPTGVSIRNALLVVQVKRRGTGALLTQSSGGTIPSFANDDIAGTQVGDLGGLPGKGFAKVLRGRINGQGAQVEPVLFIDAETVAFNQAIAPGATDSSSYRFALPAGVNPSDVDVDVRLIYRRAFRALAVTKGWTTSSTGGPIEIEVARNGLNGEGRLRDGFE
jgi:hypothetical protein